MTRTVEGVRDPISVDPDHENAVVVFALHPQGFDDIICPVDDEGWVRYPESENKAGRIVAGHSYSIRATDVDPETWGDHYHHPADCPEKDLPLTEYSLLRSTCDGCTVAREREHGRDYYHPDPDDLSAVQPVELEDLQRMVEAFDVNGVDHPDEIMVVTEDTADALREESER